MDYLEKRKEKLTHTHAKTTKRQRQEHNKSHSLGEKKTGVELRPP
jgi:hypothetical protein